MAFSYMKKKGWVMKKMFCIEKKNEKKEINEKKNKIFFFF